MHTFPPRPDGPETDGYLLAALRHAPDADQAAPAALGAAILREARAAVAPPPPAAARRASPRAATRAWDRVEAFWRAMARPPVAAGLASLMLATTLGLWWRDGHLDDPFPDRAPPPVAAPMEAATPAPRDAAPAAPVDAPAAAAEARSLAEPLRPAMQPPATPAAAPAPVPQTAAAPRATAVAPPLAPSPSAQSAVPQPAAELGHARLPGSARVEPAPSAALPAVEPPAPAEPPPPAVAMSKAQAPTPAAPSAPSVVQAPANDRAAPTPRSAPALGEAPARARSAPALAAAAAPAPADDASASTTAEPVPSTTRLAQRLRDEPARWRWSRGTSAPTALPSAVPDWLDQVAAEAAAAGVGWRLVAPPAAPRTAPGAAGTLIGADGSLHRFVLGPEGLRWEGQGSTALLLALPSPALQRLAAELP